MKFYLKKLEQPLYVYHVSDTLQLKFLKLFMDCLHHTGKILYVLKIPLMISGTQIYLIS